MAAARLSAPCAWACLEPTQSCLVLQLILHVCANEMLPKTNHSGDSGSAWPPKSSTPSAINVVFESLVRHGASAPLIFTYLYIFSQVFLING